MATVKPIGAPSTIATPSVTAPSITGAGSGMAAAASIFGGIADASIKLLGDIQERDFQKTEYDRRRAAEQQDWLSRAKTQQQMGREDLDYNERKKLAAEEMAHDRLAAKEAELAANVTKHFSLIFDESLKGATKKGHLVDGKVDMLFADEFMSDRVLAREKAITESISLINSDKTLTQAEKKNVTEMMLGQINGLFGTHTTASTDNMLQWQTRGEDGSTITLYNPRVLYKHVMNDPQYGALLEIAIANNDKDGVANITKDYMTFMEKKRKLETDIQEASLAAKDKTGIDQNIVASVVKNVRSTISGGLLSLRDRIDKATPAQRSDHLWVRTQIEAAKAGYYGMMTSILNINGTQVMPAVILNDQTVATKILEKEFSNFEKGLDMLDPNADMQYQMNLLLAKDKIETLSAVRKNLSADARGKLSLAASASALTMAKLQIRALGGGKSDDEIDNWYTGNAEIANGALSSLNEMDYIRTVGGFDTPDDWDKLTPESRIELRKQARAVAAVDFGGIMQIAATSADVAKNGAALGDSIPMDNYWDAETLTDFLIAVPNKKLGKEFVTNLEDPATQDIRRMFIDTVNKTVDALETNEVLKPRAQDTKNPLSQKYKALKKLQGQLNGG